MRSLALVLALAIGAPAAAADNCPRMRCASCSLLPAGATGSDLTLSGTLTANDLVTSGTASGVSGISASTIPTHLGSYSSNQAALWLTTSPSNSNYALAQTEGSTTKLNGRSGFGIDFQVAGSTKASMDTNGNFSSTSASAPQFACSGAGACELRSTSSGQTTRADCTGTCTVAIGDGTATTVLIGRSGQTSTINGSAAFGTREFAVDKVSSGISAGTLLATGTNYSGFKLPQAWTLTHLSINVTTASAATVANTVITTTDGTNTCTFTFACNTDSNTTGVKDKAGVNGAGTGCVYAAGALVTLSVTTQGCATAITTNSITTWGKPQ